MIVMKIGILGGTFNPIHCGHLYIAEEVLKQTDLEQILFIPNFLPPHRDTPGVSHLDRYNMVSLAIKDYPNFAVSRLELDLAQRSYTIDTVTAIGNEHPENSYSFITGSDSLVKSIWYRFEDILARVEHFYIVYRPGYSKEQLQTKLTSLAIKHLEKICWIATAGRDISSTELRQRMSQKQNLEGLVPEAVSTYIAEHQLYH